MIQMQMQMIKKIMEEDNGGGESIEETLHNYIFILNCVLFKGDIRFI